MLFADRARTPSVVLKIALDVRHHASLEREYSSLEALQDSAHHRRLAGVPVPLGTFTDGSVLGIAMSALQGRRIDLHRFEPDSRLSARELERFVAAAGHWSLTLGRLESADHAQSGAVISEYAALCNDPLGSALGEDFAHEFGRDIAWRSGWQHGDVSIGNVLLSRTGSALVDWEHASHDLPVWFDLAYVPLSLAVTARRQRGLPDERAAFLQVFHQQSKLGDALWRSLLEHWRGDIPLAHGIVVAGMLRALREPREASLRRQRLVTALLGDNEIRSAIPCLWP